jgi:hypothetical protein
MKRIPEPTALVMKFYDLYLFFKDMEDPNRPGCRFFVPPKEAWAIFKKEIKYMQVCTIGARHTNITTK